MDLSKILGKNEIELFFVKQELNFSSALVIKNASINCDLFLNLLSVLSR